MHVGNSIECIEIDLICAWNLHDRMLSCWKRLHDARNAHRLSRSHVVWVPIEIDCGSGEYCVDDVLRNGLPIHMFGPPSFFANLGPKELVAVENTEDALPIVEGSLNFKQSPWS